VARHSISLKVAIRASRGWSPSVYRSLVQVLAHAGQIAEREERVPEVHADVDGQLGLSGSGETAEGPERLLTTACAFGRAPGDESVLYVTTDSGLVVPYEGAVHEAKLLRLEVGEVGWPLIEHA